MSTSQTTRERVTLESIRIQRAPGIDGGFALTALGPGVTVIYGPNGSGKSTTARAIHSLLWPEPTDDGCLVDATLSYKGSRWTIRRDGRSVRGHRDGTVSAPLTFEHLTRDTRDRYHLALHDLLSADDRHFAALVTREASGGFDLESAAEALSFHKPPTTPGTAQRSLRDARKTLDEKEQIQTRLIHEEETLAAMNAQSAEARDARVRLIALNAIAMALDAQSERDEALAAFNHFDSGMYHVAGNDAATVAGWKTDEPLLHRQLAELEATIKREQANLANTGLPLDKDCAYWINVLNEQCSELRKTEAASREREITLASARQQLKSLQEEIAPHLPESLMTGAAISLLRSYGEAVGRMEVAEQIGAAEELLAAWIPRPEGTLDPESFRHAIRTLSGWLQTPPPPAQEHAGAIRTISLFAAAIIVAQGILLGLFWHGYAFGFIIAGMAVALAALFARGSEPVTDDRARSSAEFQRLGFDDPATWTGPDVAARLEAMVRGYVDECAAEDDASRWRLIATSLNQRALALDDANARLNILEAEMGSPVQLDRHALNTIAAALERWVKASQEFTVLERNHALWLETEEAELGSVNLSLREIDAGPVNNGTEARVLLTQLNERLATARQSQAAISQALRDRDTRVLPELARLETSRAVMIDRYAGRGMEDIESLAGQFDEWTNCLRQIKNRQEQLWSRCAQLAPGDDLTEWTPERVQTEIARYRVIDEQATELNQKIGSITTTIGLAMAGDDIAVALAAVDQARQTLTERRDEYLITSIGRLVLDEVRRETREANLPEVARRAGDLFASITHGRYLLNFNPGSPPTFSATDTTTGSEHSLDQLSSATRVQLLIAVRAAFVETGEQDVLLPMIFDETLANADAERAEALIETTFQLCESGRQIFYFTAQLDEVEKWKAMADLHEENVQVIDLGAVRKLAAANRQALIDLRPITQPVFPAPDGISRGEYRRILGVPPLNLWSEDADGGDIHLWHLTDDLQELHRLLAMFHVSHWGQVRLLTVDGRAPAIGLDHDHLMKLAIRAEACQSLVDAQRIGRGRPVTSRELQASGGMTPAFEAKCLELLHACDGNGQRFLDKLDNREIPNIRAASIVRFRDYFEEHGHVTVARRLTNDEIRARLAHRLDDAIAAGLIDLATIDRLMNEGFLTADAVDATLETEVTVLSVMN